MSLITFPSSTRVRPHTTRRSTRRSRTAGRHVTRTNSRTQTLPTRSVVSKCMMIAVLTVGALAGGNALSSARQVQLHQLQIDLETQQSNYAVSVSALTNVAAPGRVANEAGALHLVTPAVVLQIPSASLLAPLHLPKFIGSALVTSRKTH